MFLPSLFPTFYFCLFYFQPIPYFYIFLPPHYIFCDGHWVLFFKLNLWHLYHFLTSANHIQLCLIKSLPAVEVYCGRCESGSNCQKYSFDILSSSTCSFSMIHRVLIRSLWKHNYGSFSFHKLILIKKLIYKLLFQPVLMDHGLCR